METLKDILWPIVLAGGLGAFIDFLIGRTGQERAKDFLLRWWVRFDDVRWRNFGREEGLFAAGLIDRWFGTNIFSLRRVITSIAILAVFLSLGYFVVWFLHQPINISFNKIDVYYQVTTLAVYIFGFSLSVSLTKFITIKMAYLCSLGKMRNFVVFITMVALNYLVLIIWYYVSRQAKVGMMLLIWMLKWPIFYSDTYHIFTEMLNATIQEITELPHRSGYHFDLSRSIFSMELWYLKNGQTDLFALSALSSFPSVARLIVSIVFVGSFLLKPLIMRPVSLVWARIIESEKPVFTVIFGGTAAFASAINEAAKHL
jgi:hypothetical protein